MEAEPTSTLMKMRDEDERKEDECFMKSFDHDLVMLQLFVIF